VGRFALWAAIGLLLVRGTAAVLVPPAEGRPAAEPEKFDPAAAAFAVRFARAYLEDPAPAALTPFLAAGARIPPAR
jgi:hypothetical protein